jgi:hypothetical protein
MLIICCDDIQDVWMFVECMWLEIYSILFEPIMLSTEQHSIYLQTMPVY